MNLKEIEERLKAPFAPDELEFRITAKSKDNTKGLTAAYIQNRAVQNRLDEVVGFENWKNEFVIDGNSKICGLSIRINGEWITKYDGANDTNIESTKGGLSASMKRAAVQWGIGRYLYKLPGQWVRIQPKGNSYEICERPTLPNWALPKEHKTNQPNFRELSQGKSITQYKSKLSEDIESCINAFKTLGITQGELETYLSLEADTFTEKDIDTLRNVFIQIKNGKKSKDDFFATYEKQKRGQQTLKLEASLNKE